MISDHTSSMSHLPSSFQAMLNRDDQSNRQAASFSFSSSAFLMPPPSNMSSFAPVPAHKSSLPQQSLMGDPLFPLFPSMRASLGSLSRQSSAGFWSGGNTTSLLDQALQNMDAVSTSEDHLDMFNPKITQGKSWNQATQGTQQQIPPQQSLLQEQQRELRERMQYLSSLLNKNTARAEHGDETPPKRSLELPPSTVEVNFSTQDETLNHVVDQPSKKRQRLVSSSPTNEKRFRNYQAEQWNEKFDDLIKFKTKNGHCCVPHTYSEDPTLARWVKRQRYQYKLFIEGKSGSTMTELRKNLLQDLGFCWDRHSEAWEIRYSELCKFLEENGHTNVPSNHQNTQLATWVKCQRRQYKMRWEEGSVNKKTLLSDERIERLEALGFEWELRSRSKLTSAEPFG